MADLTVEGAAKGRAADHARARPGGGRKSAPLRARAGHHHEKRAGIGETQGRGHGGRLRHDEPVQIEQLAGQHEQRCAEQHARIGFCGPAEQQQEGHEEPQNAERPGGIDQSRPRRARMYSVSSGRLAYQMSIS